MNGKREGRRKGCGGGGGEKEAWMGEGRLEGMQD